MNGENRTSLAILVIAVVSLILAGVFSPQTGVEAKANERPAYSLEDVSIWLLRLAAWAPAEGAEQPKAGAEVAQPIRPVGTPLAENSRHGSHYSMSRSSPASFPVLQYTR